MNKVGWIVRPELPGPCEKSEPSKPKRSTRSPRTTKPVKKRYKLIKRKREHSQNRIAPGSKQKHRKRRIKHIKHKYLRRKLYYKHPPNPPRNPVQELPIVAPVPIHPIHGDSKPNLIAPDFRHIPQPLSPQEICAPDPGHHFNSGTPIAIPESGQEDIPAAVFPVDRLTEQAAVDSRIRNSIIGANVVPDPAFVHLLSLDADLDQQLKPDVGRLDGDESLGTIVNADTIALLAQQVRYPEEV
ncbi:hypothetical protein D3C73_758350 [compost metagenome]